MLDRTIVLRTIAACLSAMPAAAQPAATTMAFDGTYAGVSRTLAGTMENRNTRNCLPSGQPRPLTIAGGVVRSRPFA